MPFIGEGNLRSRLAHHLRDGHRDSWDRFSVYLTIGATHLKELEALILRIVKPTGNKVKGKFAKCEDIRRKFAKDVRRNQREELRVLIGKVVLSDVLITRIVHQIDQRCRNIEPKDHLV